MQPWQTVDRVHSPDGTELVLARRGVEWVVRAGGIVLMSSRVHGSEETLVKYALERVRAPRHVLLGGLGLGFTLRVALTLLPHDVPVRVVELIPELVRWNRSHLAELAGHPLDDPRVTVELGDVHDAIVSAKGTLDLLVLDIDNGPSALTQGGTRGSTARQAPGSAPGRSPRGACWRSGRQQRTSATARTSSTRGWPSR